MRFDPLAKLILVRATISGPLGRMNVRLALDTGATRTTIDPSRLSAVGIEIDTASSSQQVTTASGVETVRLIRIPLVRSLGIVREDLSVLAHRLPATAKFDGMLGLDFLRGRRISIDFRDGLIEIN